MNKEEILEKLIPLIATVSEEEEINEDSEIMDDLGISSMDVLYLIASMEAEFGVKIPEKAIRKMVSVSDVADVLHDLTK